MQTNFVVNIESSVLSSILFNSELMDEISSKLDETDFYLPAHRDIFKAMLSLHHNEMPIDEDFILKHSKNTINQNVLMEVITANPISNPLSYVSEIKKLSVRRKLQDFASQLQRNSNLDESSNDEIFNFIKDREEEIRQNGIVTINKTSILDIKESEPEFFCKTWLPIPKGTISILSAPGGTGKTWLICQIAMRIVMEDKNTKVFLWLSEDLDGIVKNRMNSICTDILNTNFDDKFKNIDTTNTFPTPLLEKSKGTVKMSSRFNQIKAELKDYDVIVLDPLLAFYGGDENDNSQARLFMQPFMNWASATNKSIIFLHHSSKSIVQNATNRTRGAGAFIDAARVCYEMNKIYKQDNQTLNDDKAHLRDIKLSKDNYGAIKHLNSFNVERHITPFSTARDFVEIEFQSVL